VKLDEVDEVESLGEEARIIAEAGRLHLHLRTLQGVQLPPPAHHDARACTPESETTTRTSVIELRVSAAAAGDVEKAKGGVVAVAGFWSEVLADRRRREEVNDECDP
jgi:hypothetical protein